MNLSSHGEVWVRSYDGTYARRAQYYVRLTIEQHDLPASPCVAVLRETVLLGRDVLNRFNIVLDGKNLRFTLRPA